MAKKQELANDLRNKIVNSPKEGLGYKAISETFGVPTSTIQSIIKNLNHLTRWIAWLVEEEREKSPLDVRET